MSTTITLSRNQLGRAVRRRRLRLKRRRLQRRRLRVKRQRIKARKLRAAKKAAQDAAKNAAKTPVKSTPPAQPPRQSDPVRETDTPRSAYPLPVIPSTLELHFLNRFTGGFAPDTWARMRDLGGPEAWFDNQLAGDPSSDHPTVGASKSWFPQAHLDPQTIHLRSRLGLLDKFTVMRDVINQAIVRRIYTEHQVRELMVDFWSNLLHVSGATDPSWVGRPSYDHLLRQHALGRFDELLVAATLHPSMLTYLDNWRSRRDAPNENHGRELLELHTVGRTAGYTEAMVYDSAVILSGWTVDDSARAVYAPDRHTRGPVSVLGFSDPNDGDGRGLAERYLRHLAHHPATARRIAARLAIRFIGEDVDAGTINTIARAYLDSGTDIAATLRALIRTSSFLASADSRVRNPVEDLVATARSARVNLLPPVPKHYAARHLHTLVIGTPLYCWPSPDGAPDRDSAWTGPAGFLSALRLHWLVVSGLTASTGATVVTLPDLVDEPAPLAVLVERVHRQLLGRSAPAKVVAAASAALGIAEDTVVDPARATTEQFQLLAATVYDSPLHLKR